MLRPPVQENVSLAPFTTIGIGGPARFFVRATTSDEVRASVEWARDEGRPLFVLGGGSNLLIADSGFDGLVMHVTLRGITLESEDRWAMVKVAAGEPWDPFVEIAVDHGWAGVECLSGIPGSTGATPIQNVGAYGQDVSETVVRVEALDRTSGLVRSFTKEECRFGYRASLFKNHEKDRYVVLAVTFRLERGGSAKVRYPELQKYLEERGESHQDLFAVREAVIAIRKRKGMVIDAADSDTKSDGSFFMNPILSPAESAAFHERAAVRVGDGSKIPSFPSPDGKEIKLSAAWLIEHSGFTKGFSMGNVGLSTKHTLAVVNRGGGTASEVVELVNSIQNGVRDAFGVEIHPEPNFIGF